MYDVYSCGFDGVIVRPKRAHKQEIHIFASDFEGPRGARGRQENERRSGPGLFLMFFDVECFVYIFRIVLPTEAGSTFSENSLKKWSDSAKWSRKTIYGKCDGYMGGLGGTKKRKC